MSLVTGGEKLKEDVSTSSAHCGTEAVGLIRKWEESLRLRDDAFFFEKRAEYCRIILEEEECGVLRKVYYMNN